MAKIALCGLCNTAIILKSWPGAAQGQPGASPDQLGVTSMDSPPMPETDEILTVPDFTLCRCGQTMAYYDDENIAMVGGAFGAVLGCDTQQLTRAITGETGEVRFYKIQVPGSRTERIQ